MFVSKLFPSFIVAVAKRPHLSAFMSSETITATTAEAKVRALLKSTSDDSYPPAAPDDSFSRTSINPMSFQNDSDPVSIDKIFHLHWKSTRHNTVATFTSDAG